MPSELDPPKEAFVWVFLPGETTPVVAGRLYLEGELLYFNYGRSYLARSNAMPLYLPELPMQPGALPPPAGLVIASSLRDAAPDAWGRRVILNRKLGLKGGNLDTEQLDELTYLLESGSDRVGALDFQASSSIYRPRQAREATLHELITAAERVEEGMPITAELETALFHGSSLGGARPKAMIEDGDAKYVAKFSSRTDLYNVVKGEFVAMRLAAAVGLNVAPVLLVETAGKDVLLVERFDRMRAGNDWSRRPVVSALTLLELDEMMARYASYEDFATVIRHRFADPIGTLRELFARLVYNILCGNTDDHARNHAAFWDGRQLALTPAYDICPQARSGGEASQAMLITGQDRMSSLATCLRAAPAFLMEESEAERVVESQVATIRAGWAEACEVARLSEIDRRLFWRRQFLNPFAFEGLPTRLEALAGP